VRCGAGSLRTATSPALGWPDGQRYKPLVKTYGRGEVRRMLSTHGFEPPALRVARLQRSQFRFLAPLVSDRLLA